MPMMSDEVRVISLVSLLVFTLLMTSMFALDCGSSAREEREETIRRCVKASPAESCRWLLEDAPPGRQP